MKFTKNWYKFDKKIKNWPTWKSYWPELEDICEYYYPELEETWLILDPELEEKTLKSDLKVGTSRPA